jgi:hypothetical protein
MVAHFVLGLWECWKAQWVAGCLRLEGRGWWGARTQLGALPVGAGGAAERRLSGALESWGGLRLSNHLKALLHWQSYSSGCSARHCQCYPVAV